MLNAIGSEKRGKRVNFHFEPKTKRAKSQFRAKRIPEEPERAEEAEAPESMRTKRRGKEVTLRMLGVKRGIP